jgi:hypothetical protein
MTCINNLKIYPTDYPAEIASSNLPGDPIIGVEDVLDAVTALQVQSRDTALRMANNRRILGYQTIQNQNRLTGAVNQPLSFAEVGKRSIPKAGILGTVAYLAGGRAYGSPLADMMAFYFGNESAVKVGMVLSEIRLYIGTAMTDWAGYYAGGLGQNLYACLDKLSFDKPAIARIGVDLSVARFGASGICNYAQGVFLGGTDSSWTAVRTGDKLDFSTDIMAPLGNKLAGNRHSAHNGTSNRTDGYLFGGTSNWSTMTEYASQLRTVEGYNYGTQNCTVLGGALSWAHISHASFGSPTVGYVAGGMANTNVGTASFAVTDGISRLAYDGLVLSAMGITLAEQTVCVDGSQSSAAGYTLGGEDAQFSRMAVSNKFIFSTEAIYSLGTTLPGVYADRGMVSDYTPGR